MLTLKIYVGVFSGIFKARMLKLYIHFSVFTAKFVSQFSLELCKLESSNMVCICRMSDCIVGLRLRVMALIFLFSSIFLSFPKLQE